MIKLIDADGRTSAFLNDQLIGFWEHETEMLFGIDRKGYAVEIEFISHRNRVIDVLSDWRRIAI